MPFKHKLPWTISGWLSFRNKFSSLSWCHISTDTKIYNTPLQSPWNWRRFLQHKCYAPSRCLTLVNNLLSNVWYQNFHQMSCNDIIWRHINENAFGTKMHFLSTFHSSRFFNRIKVLRESAIMLPWWWAFCEY
jgi:hypothetical protein